MEDVNVVRVGTFGIGLVWWRFLIKLAGTTGLEPATSCVTGMRSNQLNYVPVKALTSSKLTDCTAIDVKNPVRPLIFVI